MFLNLFLSQWSNIYNDWIYGNVFNWICRGRTTKVGPDKIQITSLGWIDSGQLWSWKAHECNSQNISGEYLLTWKTIIMTIRYFNLTSKISSIKVSECCSFTSRKLYVCLRDILMFLASTFIYLHQLHLSPWSPMVYGSMEHMQCSWTLDTSLDTRTLSERVKMTLTLFSFFIFIASLRTQLTGINIEYNHHSWIAAKIFNTSQLKL